MAGRTRSEHGRVWLGWWLSDVDILAMGLSSLFSAVLTAATRTRWRSRGALLALLCGCAANGWSSPADERAPGALILQADFAGVVMAGVAYSVEPTLTIVHVRPLIPLYDIAAASESLAYNAQSWPPGTVFVSVVDPGVGTERKSVVLRTRNDLYFVSPDNGSLSGPAEKYGIKGVREIDESVNRIPGSEWAHTFHGRDVYSYTGARLAAGVIRFEDVGPRLADAVMALPTLPAAIKDGVLTGHVGGGIDRLGNAWFSIDRDLFQRLEPTYDALFDVSIRRKEETVWSGALPYVKSFGAVPLGQPLLFIDSSGQLAVAINQGNFARVHGIGKGLEWQVTVTRHRE